MFRILLQKALILIFLCAFVLAPSAAVYAQEAQPGWSQPANLSQSGAASQARLLPGPDNTYQAFWLDQFNGLTSASFDGKAWSQPALSVLPSLPANSMPELLVDSSGVLHAFWLAGDGSLLHSSQPVLGNAWAQPDLAAGQAQAFSLAVSSRGELYLATLHTVNAAKAAAPEVPAGIYLRTWQYGAWAAPRPVFSSTYYRLIAPEQARLSLAAAGDGRMAVTWQDPRLGQQLFSESSDGGITWSPPEALGESGHNPDSAFLAFLPDGSALRLWHDPAAGGACPWFQQIRSSSGWQPSRIVFSQPGVCPDSGRLLPVSAGLLWTWGEATSRLSLAEWDSAKNAWTQPTQLSVSFSDPHSKDVTLDELRLSLAGDQMGVTGTDPSGGDVWATFAASSAVALLAAPPSPWQPPQILAQDVPQIDGLSVAVDSKGLAHAVWSQGTQAGSPTTALYYARTDGQNSPRPVPIVQAGQNEMARQPSLLVDGRERLHLAYSGGQAGEITYTRAEAAQAGSASGWLTPKVVSYVQGSDWPQLGLAPDGQLYILFAVPFNEQRGVYWLRSGDGGETWSTPALVFDAAAAGWDAVGRLALAFGPDSNPRVVFEKASLPGAGPAQGLFYSAGLAQDGSGLSFSPPEQVAPAGSRSPQLVRVGSQLSLVYAGASRLEGRHLNLGTSGSAWGSLERLPGWQDGTVAQPVFGLAAEAGAAHLAGPLTDASGLRYTTWQNAAQPTADSSWTQPDNFYFAQPGSTPSLAAAAARPDGGRLALAWVSATQKGSQLTLALRSLPAALSPAAPILIPSATPTPGPTATAEPPAPTPTRDLNAVTPGRALSANPMALGGGLAAVLVVAGLVGYLIFKNRR